MLIEDPQSRKKKVNKKDPGQALSRNSSTYIENSVQAFRSEYVCESVLACMSKNSKKESSLVQSVPETVDEGVTVFCQSGQNRVRIKPARRGWKDRGAAGSKGMQA